MRCPFCGDNDDKVIDSRSTDGGEAIRRRRECQGCQRRFTTYEHLEKNTRLTVVKNDGTRVPFDRRKLLTGLERACYKRPVTADTLNELAANVEADLLKAGEREVESLTIGNMVAERLKVIDQVAYVRFASVYRKFATLDDLFQEVREVMENRPATATPDQGMLFAAMGGATPSAGHAGTGEPCNLTQATGAPRSGGGRR